MEKKPTRKAAKKSITKVVEEWIPEVERRFQRWREEEEVPFPEVERGSKVLFDLSFLFFFCFLVI